ncbi:MAG TPA: methyltransferase dimerization domain-containing protein, partial [Candidatus Sulfopaludibacter sp.]|nr:methyltransferase dimerization domain-containing protein [Candidatus Sulfopaludibacter sp.]
MSEFDKTIDIVFGRWKSQILYTGAKLGIFDYLTTNPKEIGQIAKDLNLNESMTYRILRSIDSLGFLKEENNGHIFSITPLGELLR